MDQFKTIIVEDRGPVRLLTLNQPDMFNPLDFDSGPELARALELAQREPGVRAVVITGAGRAYAAGGNVRLMADLINNDGDIEQFFSDLAYILAKTVITLRRLRLPVVAAVNGPVAGGGLAWALGCDLVVASEKARFDPAYIRIAVSPDGAASAFVPRLIGHKRASEFFLLGKAVSAAQALEWGMINRVAPPGEVLDTAMALANELANGPAQALAATKDLLNQAVYGDLEGLMEQERQSIMRLSLLPDFSEGIRAFFEKRKPEFNKG